MTRGLGGTRGDAKDRNRDGGRHWAGRAALALMREGYTVVLAGRRKELKPSPRKVDRRRAPLCVPTDVAEPEVDLIKALFAKVKKTLMARLDVLFNNAGIGALAMPIEQILLDKVGWSWSPPPILPACSCARRKRSRS